MVSEHLIPIMILVISMETISFLNTQTLSELHFRAATLRNSALLSIRSVQNGISVYMTRERIIRESEASAYSMILWEFNSPRESNRLTSALTRLPIPEILAK